jgi:hypothetical protein
MMALIKIVDKYPKLLLIYAMLVSIGVALLATFYYAKGDYTIESFPQVFDIPSFEVTILVIWKVFRNIGLVITFLYLITVLVIWITKKTGIGFSLIKRIQFISGLILLLLSFPIGMTLITGIKYIFFK